MNRKHGVWLPIEVIDKARFSVDPGETSHQILWHQPLETAQNPASDVAGTADRIRHGNRLASTVGVKHHILRQQGDDAFHITATNSLEKALQQVVLF